MKIKNLYLALFFLFVSYFSYSQTINDIPFANIDCEYVKLFCNDEWGNANRYIIFDFGRENDVLNKKKQEIKNEKGEVIKLLSMIDALNFMSKQGYELLDSYIVTSGNFQQTHYILRKKK